MSVSSTLAFPSTYECRECSSPAESRDFMQQLQVVASSLDSVVEIFPCECPAVSLCTNPVVHSRFNTLFGILAVTYFLCLVTVDVGLRSSFVEQDTFARPRYGNALDG